MSEVKRWSIVPYDQYSVDERTSRNGEWVTWEDYEALAAERDRLKAVVDGVRNNIPTSYLARHGVRNIVEAMRDYAEQRWAEKERIRDLTAERDRLAAENARLREAVALVRTELNTQINGGDGWMARFEEIVKGDHND